MTREEIVHMAREAGIARWHKDLKKWVFEYGLEEFAALVAAAVQKRADQEASIQEELFADNLLAAIAAEREACAKVFDEMADQMVEDMEPSTAIAWVRSRAAAIRARGQS